MFTFYTKNACLGYFWCAIAIFKIRTTEFLKNEVLTQLVNFGEGI